MMETIKQKHYTDLQFDTGEKDIVQIWMIEQHESNVIMIERENIQKVIDILKHELNGNNP